MAITGEDKLLLVGVGGMGMTPLALYLADLSHTVHGVDDALHEASARALAGSSVRLIEGEVSVEDYTVLVYSSAIAQDDERLQRAREAGLRVVRRGAFLAEILEGRKLVAVVGSHGKTTTTGMLIQLLDRLNFRFSYLLGGLFSQPELPCARGLETDWVVAEIDESDGTIEAFQPEVCLLVNLDWDHPDRYESEAALVETFSSLLARTREAVFLPESETRIERGEHTFSFGAEGDYAADIQRFGSGRQRLELKGRFPQVRLDGCLGGRFNAVNALGALAVVSYLCEGRVPEEGLHELCPVRRRQEILVREPRLTVMVDYAHHPTEVGSLVEHARDCGLGKLVAVFQPHRYTRTREYAADFAKVLTRADRVILLPVYAASESPIAEGQSDAILEAFEPAERSKVCLVDNEGSLRDAIIAAADLNTHLLFIGAGDIDDMARRFCAARQSALEHWPARLLERLPEAKLKCDESMGRRTTIRLGGEARFFFEPAGVEELCEVLRMARQDLLSVFVLGRGSNLVVADEGYDGLVIHFQDPHWREITRLDDQRLEVGAGVRLQALAARACKFGLAGFEFLEGIPGSIGGALRMNAGAMGGWMFDVVEEVEYVTYDGTLHRLPASAFTVGYRHCDELRSGIATRAILRAPEVAEVEAISAKLKSFAEHRTGSQPRDPSAGCIFKNPEGDHAGRIIDELGLKGMRVGNVEISEVHGNFMVNRGGGTAGELIELVRSVRARVYAERGVELQPEVMLVGRQWEEVL